MSAVSRAAPTAGPRLGVLHIVDTLSAGGAERVAVNLVNALPRARYRVHLCTTRSDGPLAQLLRADVGRLCLARSRRWEWRAFHRLVGYIRSQRIALLHAHSSSVFAAAFASLARPYPAVIWHDHFGAFDLTGRNPWPLRVAGPRLAAVVAVSRSLATWSTEHLGLPADRVSYVPNFQPASRFRDTRLELPGEAGYRVVCVANFRAQKDHATLLRAMARVVERCPRAHLLLVGRESERGVRGAILSQVEALGLDGCVTLVGERSDVADLLPGCDIGVLSSVSEGLPLALLEYGHAGLATVTTAVGQCPEVVDDGCAGIVVPPRNPEALASAVVELLAAPERRRALGAALRSRVAARFSEAAAVARICDIYDAVLRSREPLGFESR